jgi:hypothetical protein
MTNQSPRAKLQLGQKMRNTILVELDLAGCGGTSTIPLNQNSFQITASTAPVCGAAGAQQVASKRFAVVTIVSSLSVAESVLSVVGAAPVVKLFRDGDPQGQAHFRRDRPLGPDWQEISKKEVLTCM